MLYPSYNGHMCPVFKVWLQDTSEVYLHGVPKYIPIFDCGNYFCSSFIFLWGVILKCRLVVQMGISVRSD